MPRPAPIQQPYIEETTIVRVRFNEVDSLNIVWHGHYINYFEDGRQAFGRKHGLSYDHFLQMKIPVPLVEVHAQYVAPAYVDDELTVSTKLLRPTSPKLNFIFRISREDTLIARGWSTQVFLDPNGEMRLTMPPEVSQVLSRLADLWVGN